MSGSPFKLMSGTATLGRNKGRGFQKFHNMSVKETKSGGQLGKQETDGEEDILAALGIEGKKNNGCGVIPEWGSERRGERSHPALRLVTVRGEDGRIDMKEEGSVRGEAKSKEKVPSNGIGSHREVRQNGGAMNGGCNVSSSHRETKDRKETSGFMETMQNGRNVGGIQADMTALRGITMKDGNNVPWMKSGGGRETLGRRKSVKKVGRESPEKKITRCFLCGVPALDECPWCRCVHYCSPDHQALHRAKARCLPFRVEHIQGKGRGLVATRPIRARETILIERSVLTGPALVSPPVCPACLAPVKAPILPCSRCSLPVCSPVCQESSNHRQECRLLTENRVKVDISDSETPHSLYSFILPYRLLSLRVSDPVAWSRVASLTDHIAERAGLVEWEVETKEVVNFLRRRCFLGKEYSEEDIHRAIGICAVNSISLEPRRLFSGPEKGLAGRAIFATFALLNHSCMSNARFSVDVDSGGGGGQVRVEARTSIGEGEEITVQYYNSVLGTHKRRRRLKAEWYFWCLCSRCKDPTECGTQVSAVTCELCEEGYMLPKDPLDCYSDWTCSMCDFKLEVPDLERKIDQMEEELNDLSARKDLKRLEYFIKEMQEKVLHPHHYLLLIARRNFLMICQKAMILEMARCNTGHQEDVKERWKARTEAMQEYSGVTRLLLGEETF